MRNSGTIQFWPIFVDCSLVQLDLNRDGEIDIDELASFFSAGAIREIGYSVLPVHL